MREALAVDLPDQRRLRCVGLARESETAESTTPVEYAAPTTSVLPALPGVNFSLLAFQHCGFEDGEGFEDGHGGFHY